jgi:hypothetical protein
VSVVGRCGRIMGDPVANVTGGVAEHDIAIAGLCSGGRGKRSASDTSLQFELIYPVTLSLSSASASFRINFPSLDIVVTAPRMIIMQQVMDPPITLTVVDRNTMIPVPTDEQLYNWKCKLICTNCWIRGFGKILGPNIKTMAVNENTVAFTNNTLSKYGHHYLLGVTCKTATFPLIWKLLEPISVMSQNYKETTCKYEIIIWGKYWKISRPYHKKQYFLTRVANLYGNKYSTVGITDISMSPRNRGRSIRVVLSVTGLLANVNKEGNMITKGRLKFFLRKRSEKFVKVKGRKLSCSNGVGKRSVQDEDPFDRIDMAALEDLNDSDGSRIVKESDEVFADEFVYEYK